VDAFNAAYARVKDLTFEVVGNIDADVSFGPDFFEYLLAKFEAMPKLGVAGTHYIEGDFHSFRDSYINPAHVNGQCQLFRRQCFEEIGGYVPIKGGGIDWVAVTTARMKVDDPIVRREDLQPSPKMGTAGSSELRVVPLRQEGLLRRTSARADVPERLPDDKASVRAKRSFLLAGYVWY
jgi:hypothetical protein